MAQAVSYLLILCMITMAPLSFYSDAAVSAAENPSADVGTNAEEGKFQAGNIWYKKLTEDTVQLTDGTAVTGEVTIPQTVTDEASQTEYTVVSIGSEAFFGDRNTEITKVNFPDSITDIGYCAFYGASNLQGLTLPPQLVSIGAYAFYYSCQSEGEGFDLVLPETVTEIGQGAFYRVSGMKSVKLPENLRRIRQGTFGNCENLRDITFPKQLAVIEPNAFKGCTSMTEICLPDSVTEIGENAFRYCSSLTGVTIPKNLRVLEYGVFSDCSALAKAELPENLEKIGSYVFQGCTSLTELTIPKGVTRLESNMFTVGNKGTDSDFPHIYLSGELTYVHPEFCSPQDNIIIHCTMKSSAARIRSIGCQRILLNGEAYAPDASELKFDDGTFTYSVTDPIKQQVRVDGFKSGQSGEELTLPRQAVHNGVEYTVTEIGEGAFSGCSKLKKAVLPDTITDIVTAAFIRCTSLAEINMPASLAVIGKQAFANCKALTGTLVLPGA